MHALIMVGTRPEVVKMAPVIRRLRQSAKMRVTVVATGQHREILAQAFRDFDLVPDRNLEVMAEAQSLGRLTGALFEKFDCFLAETNPDWLLVQGDTASVMAAAMCAFYRNVRVGHVEAGLRSNDLRSPFPEELNRRIATLVADVHFAPTEKARQNLLAEQVAGGKIVVTGNTVADALMQMLASLRQTPPELPRSLKDILTTGKRVILVTVHRRENHGARLRQIFAAIREVAREHPDLAFVYPVHPNPAVRLPARELLGSCENIALCEPFAYPVLLSVLERAEFVLTDSGGLQEEGCILRKPVLVLRETTERGEGVAAGAAKLLGAEPGAIVGWVNRLLAEPGLSRQMAEAAGALYGDGKAAERIAAYLESTI